MHKTTYHNINLTCIFQDDQRDLETNSVRSGMLSLASDGGALFQEVLPRRRDVRNCRLYEGKHVSIVRRKDGRYYTLLKAYRPEDMRDKEGLAYRIFVEIMEAFSSLD